MAVDILVPIAALLVILGIFVALMRFFSAWQLHRTLRKAIERDSAAAPILIERIEAIEANRNPFGNDDRSGMVLIAFALALAGYAVIALGGDLEEMRHVGATALFPLFVGAALLLRRKLLKAEIEAEAAWVSDHGA